jgi:ubiquinone/menaquinone biosynthesis C-methylase UbiE
MLRRPHGWRRYEREDDDRQKDRLRCHDIRFPEIQRAARLVTQASARPSSSNEVFMTVTHRSVTWFCVFAVAVLTVPVAARQQPQSPQRPDHMQHRFDDPERFAKSFDDPERDGWQMPARVIESLGLRPDSAVADIGAGTGYFAMRLSKAVPQGTVYAVDVEAAMLEFLRKRAHAEDAGNIVTVQAEPTSPNLPKPVDVVLIVNTYHHLPGRVTYFRELQRSLNAAGRVAIVDFRKEAPAGPPPEFRFEAAQIIDEMEQAGYRLDTRHEFLPRQHFLMFRPDAHNGGGQEGLSGDRRRRGDSPLRGK